MCLKRERCCAVRVVRVQMQGLKRRPARVCDSLLSRTASERAKITRRSGEGPSSRATRTVVSALFRVDAVPKLSLLWCCCM